MHPLIGLAEGAQIALHFFHERKDRAFLGFPGVSAYGTFGANCGKCPVEIVNAWSTHALGNLWVFLRRRTHPVLSSQYEGRNHAPAPAPFSGAPGE